MDTIKRRVTCVEYLSELNELLIKYNGDLLPDQMAQVTNTSYLKSIAYSLAVIADKLSEEALEEKLGG